MQCKYGETLVFEGMKSRYDEVMIHIRWVVEASHPPVAVETTRHLIRDGSTHGMEAYTGGKDAQAWN